MALVKKQEFRCFRRIKHFIYNTFTHFGFLSVELFYVFRIFVVCCLRLALSSGNSKSFLMRKVSTQTKSEEAPATETAAK